jgi:hypothetical protein
VDHLPIYPCAFLSDLSIFAALSSLEAPPHQNTLLQNLLDYILYYRKFMHMLDYSWHCSLKIMSGILRHMQDTVAIAVFALFYFCGATAVAVLGGRDWKSVIDTYRDDGRNYYVAIADRAMKVYSATVAISVSLYLIS